MEQLKKIKGENGNHGRERRITSSKGRTTAVIYENHKSDITKA